MRRQKTKVRCHSRRDLGAGTLPVMDTHVSVSGIRSLVRTGGHQSASEAVVFVHGNPGSSEDWTDLLSRVGAFARAVALDMPGYGHADRPRDFAYNVPGYARHLEGALKELGITRAHLVLHDFGVPWGLYWASEHPRSVASLTLINCGILPGYRWHKYAQLWRMPVLGELLNAAPRSAFHWIMNMENPKPLPRAFVDRMFDGANAGTKRAMLALYRATSARDAGSLDIADKLRALAPPTLVLWGADDKNLPASYAPVQAQYFPGAEIHTIERAGHWPFIDEPERCAAHIEAFLRRQYAAAAE